jgi:hypothetical protein
MARFIAADGDRIAAAVSKEEKILQGVQEYTEDAHL